MAAILLIEDKNQWPNLFTKIVKKSKVTEEFPAGKLAWEEPVRQILKELIREIKGPGIYNRIIKKVERLLIALVLEEEKGNQVKAARRLGINRNTLRRKIKELAIVSRVVAE
ncbi:MAG: helix-turn-helix domain-containing protein [Thermodesulfobacteriota bacterium]